MYQLCFGVIVGLDSLETSSCQQVLEDETADVDAPAGGRVVQGALHHLVVQRHWCVRPASSIRFQPAGGRYSWPSPQGCAPLTSLSDLYIRLLDASLAAGSQPFPHVRSCCVLCRLMENLGMCE